LNLQFLNMYRTWLRWCVVLVLLFCGSVANAATAEGLRARLEERPGGVAVQLAGGQGRDATVLRDFYAARDFRPLWVEEDAPGARATVLLGVLADAASEGLEPAAYAVSAPSAAADNAALTEFELRLSLMLVRYAADLAGGRFSPKKIPEQHILPEPVDPVAILNGAANAADLRAYLRGLAPPQPAYAGLRQALAQYRMLKAAGGWPLLEDGPALKPGTADERVALLRRQLMGSGDLAAAAEGGDLPAGMPRADLAAASLVAGSPEAAPTHFDPILQQAVERFQDRHGLDVDGIVGRDTRAALNVPVEDRIDQIILNMERWRWMPRDLGATHVLVNMAGFELDLIEDHRNALSMRVVVGTPYQSTPVFSDKITYLEFNPYWNIPHSIAAKELLPLIQRDPGYLTDRGIRVFTSWSPDAAELDPWYLDWWAITPRTFPFRLRQDPGRSNPLGRVKFMLPNHFAVYLHDTSSPSLFQRTVRTFSHGCIRVEKPAELAAHLLRHNPGWDLEQIQSAMTGGTRRIVTLKYSVPVHLIYATAWLDDDGTVQFRRDIYERDSILFNMLFNETR
jgi:L,D-transpeptidase YcbB